ncbi:MAG: flavin reductase [Chitinophagaceae bacterium]|jgi:flavin reductase (DIM6/NTAB) family NADH-FMN oxidoreductase RutF|nr:flavin reductase [Chitinophagaceae bacterium]
MLHFTKVQFAQWERFYRANMLNSLSGFKATHLVATVNKDGLANLSLFHNVVHLGADPALIGLVNRPLAAAPHTIANIEATGQWTMNSVQPNILPQAHQCSAKYDAEVSEFEATGLTPEYKENVLPPVVAESAIQYACNLVEIMPIKHNGTFFIIGSIEQLWVRPDLPAADGFLQLEKAGLITSTGLDAYYTTQPAARYSYAKPDKAVQKAG